MRSQHLRRRLLASQFSCRLVSSAPFLWGRTEGESGSKLGPLVLGTFWPTVDGAFPLVETIFFEDDPEAFFFSAAV